MRNMWSVENKWVFKKNNKQNTWISICPATFLNTRLLENKGEEIKHKIDQNSLSQCMCKCVSHMALINSHSPTWVQSECSWFPFICCSSREQIMRQYLPHPASQRWEEHFCHIRTWKVPSFLPLARYVQQFPVLAMITVWKCELIYSYICEQLHGVKPATHFLLCHPYGLYIFLKTTVKSVILKITHSKVKRRQSIR